MILAIYDFIADVIWIFILVLGTSASLFTGFTAFIVRNDKTNRAMWIQAIGTLCLFGVVMAAISTV